VSREIDKEGLRQSQITSKSFDRRNSLAHRVARNLELQLVLVVKNY